VGPSYGTVMGDVVPLPNNRRHRDGHPDDRQTEAEIFELTGKNFKDDFEDDFEDEPDMDEFELYLTDEDDDELIQQWEEAERECIEVLQEALPDVRAATPPEPALRQAAARIRQGVGQGEYPYLQLAAGAGWGEDLPADDRELWLGTTGAFASLRMESGLDTETEARLVSLELVDWVGAVIGLVRAGVGAVADPEDLVRYIDECPEIDGETDPDDALHVETAFYTIIAGWRATGALDSKDRLTPLGWWGLPRALGWAWQTDFDSDLDNDFDSDLDND
jgi:hypothetical protein